MLAMKFGGTSVGSAARIRTVAQIVMSKKEPVVVCSAVSGITDMLLRIANASFAGSDPLVLFSELKQKHDNILAELALDPSLLEGIMNELESLIRRVTRMKTCTTETLDHFMSFGERLSCRIVAAHLCGIGANARAYDAFDIGMLTTNEFGKAEPLPESPSLIKEAISGMDHIPIITGFIGKTRSGKITTLSRGGSDYTASFIGAAIDAEEIQIWTDVDGVMTADPRIVNGARTIGMLSFSEASELAVFGAKVLHPKSIQPAMEKNIPVRVLNTGNPSGTGTVILKEAEKSKSIAKAIACRKNVSIMNLTSTRMLNAYGYLAKIFDVFRKYHKSVDMVTTSEVSVSITLNEASQVEEIMSDLKGFAEVTIENDKAIICVVGQGMLECASLAGRILETVGSITSARMVSQGASNINISVVVENKHADDIVRALHQKVIV